MDILTQSIHSINYDEGRIIRRDLPSDFKTIVNSLAVKVESDNAVRLYNKRSDNSQIISNVRNIVNANFNKDESVISFNQDEIADRLLKTEIDVDEKSNLPSNIKKGSLIQTLFVDNDHYYYLIAKVENKEFVENDELIIKSGFTIDKDKIWKFCKFNIFDPEDEVVIDDAQVFVNNKATYWTNLFLELDQAKSNEKNTVDAFNAIDKVLSKVKAEFPADHLNLRNAFISTFRKSAILNYHDMLDEILTDYIPQNMPIKNLEKLKTDLEILPTKKHFDTSFESIPEKVKAKIRGVYDVNNDIQIILKNDIEDQKSTIYSEESNDGSYYIRIRTDNQTTIKAFKK